MAFNCTCTGSMRATRVSSILPHKLVCHRHRSRCIPAAASFRTEIDPVELPRLLSYTDSSVLLGSCFSDNIGSILQQYKFKVSANPLGTVFNPASLCKAIGHSLAIHTDNATCPTIIDTNGELFFSYDYHTSFTSEDEAACKHAIVAALQTLRQDLSAATFLVITLGTSWVYKLRSSGEIVSNCHKMPPKLFTKELLEVNSIVDALHTTLQQLRQLNPNLHVIFTVSPVRHWKDGPVQNQVSKSTLILAVHQLLHALPSSQVSYFPAYELLMDDLRDYRFYNQDLLHPSDAAVQYIWSKLQQAWLTPEARATQQQLASLLSAASHRPLHPTTARHQRFVQATLATLEDFQQRQPGIDLSAERTTLLAQQQQQA
jgi:hypothetical protein